MGCTHSGRVLLLVDEEGKRGIVCPGCGMYAFEKGSRHRRAGFWATFGTALRYFVGQRPPLPPGVRVVGREDE